jgi:molecular chaperone GrpE (heat shock protein)
MRDGVARQLEQIGRQLEEMADDNTALVAELRRLERVQHEMAATLGDGFGALRREIEEQIAYAALRDLAQSVIGPLTVLEEMADRADLTDPRVAAGHLRGLSMTLRGVLTRLGAEIVPIVVGQDRYDPERHRCVRVLDPAESPYPQAAPHTVVRVLEDGYVLRKRPLSPAQVEIQADHSR